MLIKLFPAEIFFCVIILIKLVLNTRLIRNSKTNFPLLYKETFIQILILLLLVLILLLNSDINGVVFNLFYCNLETQQFKVFFLITTFILIPFIKQSLMIQKINFIEYDILFLFSVLSGLLIISSSDLLVVYIIIEMQALCFYVLASFRKNSAFSTEAGIKYFIFGSIFSCFFLLSLSILYGITGTLNFYELNLLSLFYYPKEFDSLLNVSVFFFTILFFFKLAAVPFHFWAPDVYEGSPLASTIIFSILTKPILINLFIKWIFIIGHLYLLINNWLALTGLFSIIIGSFLALKQKRFKKLIIYSSIAQVGFILLSLSLNNYDGMVYTYFFLFAYIMTSILIWGNISYLSGFDAHYNFFFKKSSNSVFISDLINMFEYNSTFSIIFIIIFFSVGGIPPLVGFLAKIFILLELVYAQLNSLAVFVILVSSISIFYYIRIIKIIFFESSLNKWSNIKTNQIFFNLEYLNISFYFIILLQTFLLILFFLPENLIYLSHFFVLTSTFF
jgi:proton-translocating NADH-quinone oxidoreductase chain N